MPTTLPPPPRKATQIVVEEDRRMESKTYILPKRKIGRKDTTPVWICRRSQEKPQTQYLYRPIQENFSKTHRMFYH